MFAAPMAAISPLPLTVSPRRAAKVRESTRGVGEGDERDAGRGQRQRRDIRPLEPAERGRGEPLRQRTDHRQPVGEAEDGGERGRRHDRDEHAAAPATSPR